MSWRWPWRRPARVEGPDRAAYGSRSRRAWADLTHPEVVLAQAAEVAARQAAELAALERVLNEPTMILSVGCGCRRSWWRTGGPGGGGCGMPDLSMPGLPPVASPGVERCWQIMAGLHIATQADAIDYL